LSDDNDDNDDKGYDDDDKEYANEHVQLNILLFNWITQFEKQQPIITQRNKRNHRLHNE